MAKILTSNRIETGKTIDVYVNEMIKPNLVVLNAFNVLGKIFYCYQSEKEEKELDNLDKKAKEKLPGYGRHTLSLLCITSDLFNKYFDSDNEKDSICVTNPSIDIYEKEGPVNIFNNPKLFVKTRLDETRNCEGIGVLDINSYNITHNGLYIPPVSQIKLKKEFGIKDDIELINKIGYPTDYPLDEWPKDVKPPEIGTRSKAMISYSKKHSEISFIVMNKHSYIVQDGIIINKKTPKYFKGIV